MKAYTSIKPTPESKELFKLQDLSGLNRHRFTSSKTGYTLYWDRLEGGFSYSLKSRDSHTHSGEFSSIIVANVYKEHFTKRWRYYLRGEFANSCEIKAKGTAKDLEEARIKTILALIFNHPQCDPIMSELRLYDNPTKMALLRAVAKEWGMHEDSTY